MAELTLCPISCVLVTSSAYTVRRNQSAHSRTSCRSALYQLKYHTVQAGVSTCRGGSRKILVLALPASTRGPPNRCALRTATHLYNTEPHCLQARGAFSHLEVACVMERRFFGDAKNAAARAGVAQQPGGKEEFMVAPADCAVPGAVWWTRRGVY